jgi:hypothetical protein
MPAMTMLFGVSGATLRTLHPSDAIEGTVEDAGSTWRLGSVVVAGPAPPERYIPVLEVGSSVPELRLVDQSERPFSLRTPGGTNPSTTAAVVIAARKTASIAIPKIIQRRSLR